LRGGLPAEESAAPALLVTGEADVTANEKEFTVLVRNAVFAVLRALARKDWLAAASLLEKGEWTAERLEAELAQFFLEHAAIRIDPKARSPENTRSFQRRKASGRSNRFCSIRMRPTTGRSSSRSISIVPASRPAPCWELRRVEGAVGATHEATVI